ncbi:MAG TPA: Uma2 family endonuclease [Blastocatellia bacterium]|nr:Uma2 family endonuclease [Blastocatellia bacterium]
MSATLQPVTANELLSMTDDGFRYELIKGELRKTSPSGNKHGRTASRINGSLDPFVSKNKLSAVYAAETGFLISTDPDTVRAPDVAFIAQSRLDEIGDMEGFLPCAPDFVVEVISPSDTYAEVEEKVFHWLSAGSRVVAVANGRNRTVTIYRSRTNVVILTGDDILEVNDILPGWSITIKDIFE